MTTKPAGLRREAVGPREVLLRGVPALAADAAIAASIPVEAAA